MAKIALITATLVTVPMLRDNESSAPPVAKRSLGTLPMTMLALDAWKTPNEIPSTAIRMATSKMTECASRELNQYMTAVVIASAAVDK